MPVDPRDRGPILFGILLVLFLGALDQTIVSTALPKIAEDLQGVDRYAWVVTAYLLASTCLVPIYGRLADIHSRRTIQLGATTLFLAGSALCGLAGEFGDLPLVGDGMNQLILFRGIQGAGGAGLFAMTFIVIADLYPPAERGRYQGLVGAAFGVASVMGPLVGGLLTDHAGGVIPGVEGWRWVFWVNLPLGGVALWFLARRMPPLEPAGEGRLDRAAALLLVGGLAPLVLALQLDRVRHPWTGGTTMGLLAVALLFLGGFVRRSLRSRDPIVDPGLFREPVFASSTAAVVLYGATFLGVLIFLPLYVVNVLGVSATRAGVAVMPLSLGVVLGSITAGQVVARIGHYRRILLLSGAVMVLGTWLISGIGPETEYLRVTLYMVVVGIGVGPSFPLFTLAVQNAVDVRRVGQATSAVQFFRQIGGTLGIAVMGSVLTAGLVAAFVSAGLPAELVSGGAEGVARLDGLPEGTLSLVREGFARSITRVFRLTMWIAAGAWILTLLLPERRLRTTPDR